MSSKYINDLRDKCKDKTDHDFVDAMEHIITEFEKPREPLDPYRFMIRTPEFDKAFSDLCNEFNLEAKKEIKINGRSFVSTSHPFNNVPPMNLEAIIIPAKYKLK